MSADQQYDRDDPRAAEWLRVLSDDLVHAFKPASDGKREAWCGQIFDVSDVADDAESPKHLDDQLKVGTVLDEIHGANVFRTSGGGTP